MPAPLAALAGLRLARIRIDRGAACEQAGHDDAGAGELGKTMDYRVSSPLKKIALHCAPAQRFRDQPGKNGLNRH